MRRSVFLAVMLGVGLSACQGGVRPAGLPREPRVGPEAYRAGWREGCETGIKVYGNDLLRATHRTAVTPGRMDDPAYRNAWLVGNRYCRFYVSSYLMDGHVDRGFGAGLFDNRKITINDTTRDLLWGDVDPDPVFRGFDMLGWGMDQ